MILAWCSPQVLWLLPFRSPGTSWLRSFHGTGLLSYHRRCPLMPAKNWGCTIDSIFLPETFWEDSRGRLRSPGGGRWEPCTGENRVFHRGSTCWRIYLIKINGELCLKKHHTVGHQLGFPVTECCLLHPRFTSTQSGSCHVRPSWIRCLLPRLVRFHWFYLGGPRQRDLAQGVKCRLGQLSQFTQWKMLGQGTYVLGFEPANCRVEGRAKERERGTLQNLAPQEERLYELEIGLVTTPEELVWLQAQVAACQEEKGT